MWQIWSYSSVCPDNKVSVKENRGCAADQMLEGGFVAKASSLKPRPSLLYLEAKIAGRNVSCLVGTGATRYFMSPKLAKELGLPMRRAGKPINVRFVKGELHKTKEMAFNMHLKCGTFEFKENFTFYKMDEVELILETPSMKLTRWM